MRPKPRLAGAYIVKAAESRSAPPSSEAIERAMRCPPLRVVTDQDRQIARAVLRAKRAAAFATTQKESEQ